MRKTLGTCLLALLLANSASAGIIPNDAPSPDAAPNLPPPPTSAVQEPADTTQDATTAGIIPNDAADSLTQAALELLALLPSLL